GLTLVEGAADVVLLGRDETFSYERLTLAVNEIQRGASLVVTNPDTSHPGEEGCLVPETGALMRGIVACTAPPAIRVIGKPQPDLFLEALQRLGSVPSTTLVIGDNPETDGAGATRQGMRHVLVGSGSDRHVDDLVQLLDWLSRDQISPGAIPRRAPA
ncbi:MAG: HAD hydrolase-like protein, partial [Kiloniellales bacterium]|nr:HAD hydrolase-like protein [Kiloniellales bacterium]